MSYISIPEAGINHANFERLAKNECIDMMFNFAYYLDEDAAALLDKLLNLWINKTNWKEAGGKPVFITEIQENILHLAITNVRSPQKAIRMLVFELQRVPLGLESVYFCGRKVSRKGRMEEVLQEPLTANQVVYNDEQAWWDASFDWEKAPPISEQVERVIATTADGQSQLMEKRGMRLYLDDCRIVYGTAGAEVFSRNNYCTSIATYLTQLFGKYFHGFPPKLLNKYGDPDHVDLLIRQGRQGYRFRLEPALLTVNYPKTFRFKEYELMLLLREAIQTLHLSPVIHWTRDEYYEINLWESWVY